MRASSLYIMNLKYLYICNVCNYTHTYLLVILLQCERRPCLIHPSCTCDGEQNNSNLVGFGPCWKPWINKFLDVYCQFLTKVAISHQWAASDRVWRGVIVMSTGLRELGHP